MSISQAVSLAAGTAEINFSIEERSCCGSGNETVNVYLDNTLLGNFTPTSTSAFNAESTTPIAVTAGSHTIGFAGIGGTGDTTIFVDSVSITNIPVPEPGASVLFAMGATGLLGILRLRRRS